MSIKRNLGTFFENLGVMLSGKEKSFTWDMAPAEVFGRVLNSLYRLHGGSKAITSKLQQIYENRSWVYVCNSLIANKVSEIPWQLEQKNADGLWEQVKDHPLIWVLESPYQPYGTDATLKNLLAQCMNLTGEFQVNILTANGAGRALAGLTPFDPSKVVARMDGKGGLAGWQIPNGELVPVDSIVFGCYPRVDNYYRGMSPIEAIASAVDLNAEMPNYNAKLLKNEGRPALLLSPEEELDDLASKSVKRWAEEQKGNPGGIKLMPFGVKAVGMGLAPRELDFLNGRRSIKEEILSAYNTPEILVSGKDANRSTMEIATAYWLSTCIWPMLSIIESAFTRQIVWRFGGPRAKDLRLRFLREPIEFADDKMKRQEMELRYGCITINEYRQEHGKKKPLAWGDEKPGAGGGGGQEPVVVVDEDKPGENEPGKKPPIKVLKEALPVNTERLLRWKAWDNVVRSQEVHLADALGRYNSRIGRHVAERARQQWKQGGSIDISIYDLAEATGDMNKVVLPYLKQAVKSGYFHAEGQVRKPLQYNPAKATADVFIKNMAHRNTELITNTTMNKIKDLLARVNVKPPEKQGQYEDVVEVVTVSIDDFLKELDGIFEEAGGSRALMASATMTIGSVNWGMQDGYNDAGVESKEWLTQQDDKVRDSHQMLDGETVGVSSKFSNGLMFPGDPLGPPDEVINCRCTMLPVEGE